MFDIKTNGQSAAGRIFKAPAMCTLPVALLATFGCGQGTHWTPGETYNAAYILADRQSRVSHTFTVRNPSAHLVRIDKVERTCGCTSFTLDKSQLAPGESTRLHMDVDVPNVYMQKAATCILKTDHPRFRDWTYTIQFVSLPPVVTDPTTLNLGAFNISDDGRRSVHKVMLDVFSDSEIVLNKNDFIIPEEIDLEISPTHEARRLKHAIWNTRYQVSVQLSSQGRESLRRSAATGIIAKTVRLSGSTFGQWTYPIFWERRSPLVSHPSFLSFGNLLSDGNDSHAREVVISSTLNKKFKIISVKNQSVEVPLEATFDSSNEDVYHKLKIIIREPRHACNRFLSGSLIVETTERLQRTLEIHWSAIADPPNEARSTVDRPN